MAKITKKKLSEMLKTFREGRETAKSLDAEVKETQPVLIEQLRQLVEDGHDFVFDNEQPDGKNAAFVIQGEASEIWDIESVMDYVREDKKRWMACSSRVIDFGKFEAEVANGNISAKVAKKLKKMGNPPKPYIQFRKPDDKNK